MMKRRTSALMLDCLHLKEGAAIPLYQQLYRQVREAVVTRRLQPGSRLPSSRMLADELGISRNTVTTSYELLTVEGYLDATKGSGTFVSKQLPEHLLRVPPSDSATAVPGTAREYKLSQKGAQLVDLSKRSATARRPRAFSPGMPDLAAFPPLPPCAFPLTCRLEGRSDHSRTEASGFRTTEGVGGGKVV